MALLITDECISCGACLPECPNEAIFETRSDAETKGNHVGDGQGVGDSCDMWNDQPALYFLDEATRVFSPFPMDVRHAAFMDHHGRALWSPHNAYASAGQYRQRGDHHGNICRSTVPQRSRSLYWGST